MDLEQARTNMVKQQIHCCEVFDEAVLQAFNEVPRENFVPTEYKKFAFAEMSIPLPHGEIMFCPKEEAQMVQSLALKPDDNVLEIGTGSGYITAILASLVKQVTSVDVYPEFTQQAQTRLQQLARHNVTFATGNAADGWPGSAPFTAILISGSVLQLPRAFGELLSPGGRLFAIVGQAPAMMAQVFVKTEQGDWRSDVCYETMVPRLLGAADAPTFVF